MTERPIIFSGAMVRALLDGTKTQTRRVVKIGDWPERGVVGNFSPAPEEYAPEIFGAMFSNSRGAEQLVGCPFGAPGDRLLCSRCGAIVDHRAVRTGGARLWVRETWVPHETKKRALYRADHPEWTTGEGGDIDRWRPSIHMPRWASRITLEVTGVRVERLCDISEEDARAEGARRFDDLPSMHPYGQDARWSCIEPKSTEECLGSARMAFANLWESINGAESWAENPWVWVINFKRVTP